MHFYHNHIFKVFGSHSSINRNQAKRTVWRKLPVIQRMWKRTQMWTMAVPTWEVWTDESVGIGNYSRPGRTMINKNGYTWTKLIRNWIYPNSLKTVNVQSVLAVCLVCNRITECSIYHLKTSEALRSKITKQTYCLPHHIGLRVCKKPPVPPTKK